MLTREKLVKNIEDTQKFIEATSDSSPQPLREMKKEAQCALGHLQNLLDLIDRLAKDPEPPRLQGQYLPEGISSELTKPKE